MKKRIKIAAIIAGVIVIPLLYSYFYLDAFWDPYNRLSETPVAVVSEDKGAAVNGTYRNLGDEAAHALVKDGTMKFERVSESEAMSGTRGDKYYAVITFPADFSQNVASASTAEKKTAQIEYGANKKRNYIASQVMKTVVANVEETARGNVDQEITAALAKELKAVPAKLGDLGGGLAQIQSGAAALSSGASQAAEGQKTLSSGIGSLNAGLSSLKTGGAGLSAGLYTLSSGLEQASSGADTLSQTAAQKLPLLQSGAAQAAAGAKALLAQFSTSGNPQNPTVYDGVSGVSKGAQALLKQFSPSGSAENPTVYDGVSGVASGAQSYSSAVNNTLYTMITASPQASAAELAAFEQQLPQAEAAYASATDPAVKAQAGEQLSMLANLVTLYTAALSPGVKSEAQFEAALTQAAAADSAKQTVVSGGAALTQGARQVLAQFKQTGAFRLGMEQLAAGSKQVDAQFEQSGAFRQGAQQLAAGSQQVSAGTQQLGALAQGAQQLSAALSKLSQGSAQAYTGAQQLASGAASAQSGAAALQSGSQTLAQANVSIAGGASKLASGAGSARSGVSQSISEANRSVSSLNGLDTYAKAPVSVKENDVTSLPNYGSAFAPYFMSLSLWVGALMMFFGLYLDADERIKILSRHSTHRFARIAIFCAIGIAQAVALALIVHFALGLTIANVPAYYLSCILISLVFLSIVEFLIVNLKDVGKFLSILFLVLQLTACGGTFPMETVPKLFRVLYPYMPMTYSVKLLKETSASFSASAAWGDVGMLLGIFVAFTGLTVVFSIGRRTKAVLSARLSEVQA